VLLVVAIFYQAIGSQEILFDQECSSIKKGIGVKLNSTTTSDYFWETAQYSLIYTSQQPETIQISFDYTIYYVPSESNTPTNITLRLDNQELMVANPAFIFIPPGKSYLLKKSLVDPLLCLRLRVDKLHDIARQIAINWHTSEIFFLQTVFPITSTLGSFFTLLLQELRQAPSLGQQLMLDTLVIQVGVLLLRHYCGARHNPHLEISRFGLVDRRLRRAIEYIHTHYANELTLADIAETAFLSEYHFAHLFKKILGIAPHQYLAAVRVEQARHLIINTDLSLATISLQVGYSSQSHFTKIFRHLTGITPARYREFTHRAPLSATSPSQ
jgi:AraC-like DNA-binding protein